MQTATTACAHFLRTATCKFGDACRFLHDRTNAVTVCSLHAHALGPDPATKRKRNFCDACGKKTKQGSFRCTVGCDFDICAKCLRNAVDVVPVQCPAALSLLPGESKSGAATRAVAVANPTAGEQDQDERAAKNNQAASSGADHGVDAD